MTKLAAGILKSMPIYITELYIYINIYIYSTVYLSYQYTGSYSVCDMLVNLEHLEHLSNL